MGELSPLGPVLLGKTLVPVPEPLANHLRWSQVDDKLVDKALELISNGRCDLLDYAYVFSTLSHDIAASSKFMVKHVLQAAGCRRCTLFVADTEATLTLAAYAGVPEDVAAHLGRVQPDGGVIGWVWSHGVPLLVRDVGRLRMQGIAPERYRSRSFASIPLRNDQDRVIGVVNVTDPHDSVVLSADRLTEIVNAVNRTAPIVVQAWRSYQLLRLSYLDPLTGLFNRRFLDVALDYYLSAALRDRFPVSLLVVDVDHFKRINDRYGHQIGDEVLRIVADLLRQHFRSEDVVCRLGGEEFAIIMPRRRRTGDPDAPSAQETEAVGFAERLRQAVESCSLDGLIGEPGNVTISCGIATFPHDAADGHELLCRADQALYRAKKKGRNRIEVYCPVCGLSVVSRTEGKSTLVVE